MLYGDRGYWIAHSHSRTEEVFGRALSSGGRDDHTKDEVSDVPEHLGDSGAGRSVPAVRPRRLRRAT
jgi:hypothetical protein